MSTSADPPSPAPLRTCAVVARPAPDAELVTTQGRPASRRRVRISDHLGRWLVLVFYPRDFTFVCPTELVELSANLDGFQERQARLLGISVDDIETHERWLTTAPVEGGVAGLRFPLGSDPEGEVSRAYGVWDAEHRVALRGLFIIDPEGILQYAVVHNLGVGRNHEEVLRVLDALRTGGLCPASWTLGDGTIDPTLQLSPGRVLGHYRIQEDLGGGAFGQVYAAFDLWLQRMVALKVLKPGNRAHLEPMLEEARAAAGLSHPSICNVYSVERLEGLPTITMEYLSGITLGHRIAEGTLEPEEARRIGRCIAEGMKVSHAAQVIHGDLKPTNVMLTDDGQVKILDFGIAIRAGRASPEIDDPGSPTTPDQTAVGRALEELSRGGVTGDDTVTIRQPGSSQARLRGTLAYMAPELLRGEPASEASDVFAFGLILVEMLLGVHALEASTVHELLLGMRALDGEALAGRVPPAFRELVARALSQAPDQRPSMVEVLELI